MASVATPPRGEEEPLLGQPGDVQQQRDDPLYANVYIGTAALAQAGIWLLTVVVWVAIFGSDLMLFSAHPLLNSAGLLLLTQAILVLQPTHTAQQKQSGTLVHAAFHALGVPTLLAGLVVIEYNKFDHNGLHFGHIHNILGIVTYVLIILQSLVGVLQYWAQGLLGGEQKAKALWKYHRAGGYVTLIFGLATVCAATDTDFNKNLTKIPMYSAVVPAILVVVGVLPRIKLQKLGLKQ